MSLVKKRGKSSLAAVAIAAMTVAASASPHLSSAFELQSGSAGSGEGSAAPAPSDASAGAPESGSGRGTGATPTGNAASTMDRRGDSYIVVLAEPSLASYKGGVAGLAQPPRKKGVLEHARVDVTSKAAVDYVQHLEAQQSEFRQDLSATLGRPVSSIMGLQHAINAVVVRLSEQEANIARGMPGVRLVEAYQEYTLDTDTGPALIGAPPVWNGTNPGAPAPYRGEGVVVGIIDSGINFGSPSFAGVGPVDGYAHINPLGSGNYLGTCAPGGVDAGRCNDKLIGGYDFVCSFSTVQQCTAANSREEPGFGDTNSHGSHVASTVAGNLRDADFSGNTLRISGVAPRSNIVAYDACYTNTSTGQGLCPNVSTLASVDQAVADGIVDVLNYSIGGGTSPWTESTSLAFLGAVDAGIYVAAAAGNSGPGANTMGNMQPWVSTTAAAQHGRAGFGIAMSVTGPTPVPANLAPLIVNQGSGGVAFSAPIPGTTPLYISAGINGTSDGCAAYPANTFAGGIAVVRRGTCSFAIKVNNASAAGAIAVIIANNAAGVILPSVPGTTVPVFSVTQAEGNNLRDFEQANPTTATAQIAFPAVALPNTPDALAAFSSRGPAGTFNIAKPDVTAPGVDVLAVMAGTALTGSENLVGLMSGTSMASPHHAGAAALIKQARPTWTAPEIKSALSMTATQTVYLEDQVTLANTFARGSGRIRVDQAINSGLVMNETRANYLAADPATGGEPANLNQPNLINRSCFPRCVFNRTFRNTTGNPATWRLSLEGGLSAAMPSSMTLAPNGSATVRITLFGSALPNNGSWNFGNLVLTSVPADASPPQVLRLPIVAANQPPQLVMPSSIPITMGGNATSSASYTLRNAGGSNLSYNFVTSGAGAQALVDATSQGVASGFRNTVYTDPATAGSQAQFAADDFELTQATQITSVFTQGFVVSGTALTTAATNITWSIYPDASGVPAGNPQSNPGAASWTYTTTPAAAGVTTVGSSDILLNLVAAGQNVNLPAGRYWLLVNTRGTFANRFAHYGSNTQSGNAGFASLTVATNGSGNWTANPSFAGLTMRIVGNVPCGAPWIAGSFAPSGTLARGESRTAVTVAGSAGLAPGSYRGNICVQSNDPINPSVAAPLQLTVTP